MNIELIKEQARAHEWDEEWSEAIALYKRALDATPSDSPPDTALFNRVGDLQIKMGDLGGAIDNYLTAADLYLEAELPNAAIAICRKILRTAPNRAEVFLKMGQIRAGQGFLTDARQNFLTYAERKQRAGDMEEAFRALVEFVELAPDDAEIRRALADRLLKHDRSDSALDQYRLLYFQLIREDRDEAAEEVEGIIRTIDAEVDLTPPADPPGWRELQDVPDDHELVLDLPAPVADLEGSGELVGGFETTALIEPPLGSTDPEAAEDGAGEEDEGPSDGAIEVPAARGVYGPGDAIDDPLDSEESSDDWMAGVRLEPAEAPDTGLTPPEDTVEETADDSSGASDGESLAEAPDELPDESIDLPAHEAFAADGDWTAASEALEELFAKAPNDIPLRQRAVEYAFRAHEPVRLAGAYLGLAESLRASGEDEKARAVFRQVISIDPDHAAAREALGEGPSGDSEKGSEAAEVASSEDYVDLGSLILGEEEERTTRWKVEAAEPSGDEQADFAEMLVQFKAKVAAHVDMDDIRAHYDLGTAYKDMGLLDEAISEFQLALRADAHHLPTHEVLGETFLEKGEPDVAVRSLQRAVDIPREVEDDLLGIFYYLGRAHEELGNRDSALEFYERAFSLDINFRDVTERLRQLR